MKVLAGAGLSYEADFLRRNNNRFVNRQKKIRAVKLGGIHFFFAMVMLCFLGYGIYKVGMAIAGWERLVVNNFNIINLPQHSLPEVKEILSRYRDNVLLIDLENLQKELLQINEVKGVSLARRLPASLDVNFVLRKPVLQFKFKSKYNIMDHDGVVLYTSDIGKDGLITARNLNFENVEKLLPYVDELTSIKEEIEYVCYKQPYGVVMKLKKHKELFYPGEKDYASRIALYMQIKNEISGNGAELKYADLRFKDRIFLGFEEGELN